MLSQELSKELVEAMREAYESPSSKSIVLISSKPGCFIAGADISMLDAAESEEEVCVCVCVCVVCVGACVCVRVCLVPFHFITTLIFIPSHFPLQLRDISTEGQSMIQKLEDCPKPVVAAIAGSCLGGGLEVKAPYSPSTQFI